MFSGGDDFYTSSLEKEVSSAQRILDMWMITEAVKSQSVAIMVALPVVVPLVVDPSLRLPGLSSPLIFLEGPNLITALYLSCRNCTRSMTTMEGCSLKRKQLNTDTLMSEGLSNIFCK